MGKVKDLVQQTEAIHDTQEFKRAMKMGNTYYKITEKVSGKSYIVNGLELVELLITIPDLLKWEQDGGTFIDEDKYEIVPLEAKQQKAAKILYGGKNKKKGQP